jgi:hypothetical protein
MDIRLIGAKTTDRNEAQTCISEQHSVHRSCIDLLGSFGSNACPFVRVKREAERQSGGLVWLD